MEKWSVVSLAAVVVATCTWAVMADPIPTNTTVPELLGNDTSDQLMVGSSSKYCDWDRRMGPVCVYNASRQVSVY